MCSSVIPPLDFEYCLFPLLFSFSIVITAGNVTQLAGCGAMPISCAHRGADSHSGWLMVIDREAKLRYAQQWKDHQMLQAQLLLPFCKAEVQGFAALFNLGKPCVWIVPYMGFLLQLEKVQPK